MGVQLNFRDFHAQYNAVTQGVFWMQSEHWYPQGLSRLNLGLSLSEQLLPFTPVQRREKLLPTLRKILNGHESLILENIQVLFLPSLELDIPTLMVSLARNRVLCIVWPGQVEEKLLIYAEPSSPEYASYDFTKYADTYVITR